MDAPTLAEETTALLDAIGRGEPPSGALFERIYGDLRQIAQRHRSRWIGNDTLNTTALVHEAYIKLENASVENRAHLLAVASRAMRQVLVSYGEARKAQKRGGVCGFVDAEHALDPVYARKLGVDLDNLLVSQPDTGEQALEITDTLVRSGAIDILVIDSVAALTPRAEIEGEMGDSLPGMQARLMSQALRKLTGSISRSKCMVIFINQIRMKIGVMFGSPETTTGGNALKFYASVRLDIRRIGSVKDRDEVTGNQTRVKVVKNKLAPPFKQVEFDIMYGEGVSKMGELVDLGVKSGIVEKSGAWFSYNSQRLGQGRENAKTFLRDNPEMANEIEIAIRQSAGVLAQKLLDDGRESESGED